MGVSYYFCALLICQNRYRSRECLREISHILFSPVPWRIIPNCLLSRGREHRFYKWKTSYLHFTRSLASLCCEIDRETKRRLHISNSKTDLYDGSELAIEFSWRAPCPVCPRWFWVRECAFDFEYVESGQMNWIKQTSDGWIIELQRN